MNFLFQFLLYIVSSIKRDFQPFTFILTIINCFILLVPFYFLAGSSSGDFFYFTPMMQEISKRLIILSIILFTYNFLFGDKNFKEFASLLGFLPALGVMIIGSYDFIHIFILWVLSISIILISMSFERINFLKDVSVAIHLKVFFILNFFTLSLSAYFLGTGGTSILNIEVLNHERLFLFLTIFSVVGVFWAGIFPFSSWLLIYLRKAPRLTGLFCLLWLVAPLSLKFLIIMTQLLPIMEYSHQIFYIRSLSLIAIFSMIYSAIILTRLINIREIIIYLIICLNSMNLVYFLWDPLLDNGIAVIELFIISLLLMTSLYFSSHKYVNDEEEGSFKGLSGLFYSKKQQSLIIIAHFLLLLGLPSHTIFDGRVRLFNMLLTESAIYELVAVFITLLILSIMLLRWIRVIMEGPSSKKNIAPSSENFYENLFRVIFLVCVFITVF